MNAETTRKDLKKFVGDEQRYRRFIRQIRTSDKDRLSFWQEKLVNDFSRSEAGYVLSYADLLNAFDICEIHEIDMKCQEVKVSHAHIDVFHGDYDIVENCYPNYLPDRINGPRELQGKYVDIKFCPECNRVYRGEIS